MPRFTVDLSDAQLAKLQAVVDQTNQNAGTALTVAQWLQLHVKEVAYAADLAAASDALRRQAEADAQASFDAALRAERDRLLGLA